VSEAEERYLHVIGRLEAAGERATVTAVARGLSVSKASVSEMLNRLEGEGLLVRGPAGEATFTARGREAASALAERRDVVERFLRDVLGVGPGDLAAETERMVRVVSPRLEERMRARLSALARP
jgi:DtxR family Mn-dependent transcriptional regulator